MRNKPVAGTGGDHYVPYDQRTGAESTVYFTRDLSPDGLQAIFQRIETRHGLRQLSYMKALGMGNDRYTLVDIDNADAVITAADAVTDVCPFVL